MVERDFSKGERDFKGMIDLINSRMIHWSLDITNTFVTGKDLYCPLLKGIHLLEIDVKTEETSEGTNLERAFFRPGGALTTQKGMGLRGYDKGLIT